MVIDVDRFKQVNDSVGMALANSILLTLSRRLGRLIKPHDTLARLSGDQFGLVFVLSERNSARITALAETVRRTLRAPITFNDREIFLTGSVGLALGDRTVRHLHGNFTTCHRVRPWQRLSMAMLSETSCWVLASQNQVCPLPVGRQGTESGKGRLWKSLGRGFEFLRVHQSFDRPFPIFSHTAASWLALGACGPPF